MSNKDSLPITEIPKRHTPNTAGKWIKQRCFLCNEDITLKDKYMVKRLRISNSPHHGRIFCSYKHLIQYCQQQLTKEVIIN